ncbi:MAG TPA: tetratricopeptide repeat protein [Methylomirabilota bacterium]|nr:tetratricopeptide repeat protein [Methylomirabilota bacterium]
MEDARRRLLELADTVDGRSLAEAALWIAVEAYPELDVRHWLARVEALGRRATERVTPDQDVDRAAAAIARLLFQEAGFRGNAADYYDPRNSFLNAVLERRLGIPITLSVLFIAVAGAVGLRAAGVGLPGHFVVQVERAGRRRLVDPFHGGRLLEVADCAALIARLRPGERFDAGWLRPVTTRHILARMLANLKAIYVGTGDWERALGAVDRILLLAPDAHGELRDRGTLHARLGHGPAALRDWASYLERAPGAPDAAAVREELLALRRRLAARN